MIAPPLLVSYSSLDDYLSCLSSDIHNQYFEEIRNLVEQELPPVASFGCLALLFGYSPKFVNAMSVNRNKYYRTFKIPKGKKKRVIQAPRVALKVIQKWIGYHLAAYLPTEDYIFGFVSGKSSVDAAAVHCNSSWVYSVDIENFFPSTDERFVAKCLEHLGYTEKAANIIASLCCFEGGLAQGAPSSPTLSNIAMRGVDQALKSIADEHEIRFTRYADDVVFSSDTDFPEAIKQQVADTFASTCWVLSKDKEYMAFADKGQRLKVHGLLVDGERPRLTKGYRNKIRAYKYMLKQGKIKKNDLKTIVGHVNHSNYIDSKDYK